MLERMFNYENPVWQFMNRVADLIILNLMFIFFSVPIITIGASWTALYYTTVKMVRKEDTYVYKEFWVSFKSNFKQATILWLILGAILAWLGFEILLFFNHPELLPKALKILTIVGFCLVLIIAMYVFPLLSHFENDNKKTFTNAIILAILNVPRTIWLFVLLVTPIVIVMVDMRTMIFYAFLGISLPALISSLSWSAIFKKYEPKKEVEDNGDDWVLEVEEGEASDESNTTEDEAEEKPQDID